MSRETATLDYIKANYRLVLRPLTPIHVWAGSDAIVGVDAFEYDGRLYILTEEDIRKLSAEEIARYFRTDPRETLRMIFEHLKNKKMLREAEALVKTQLAQGRRVRLLHKNVIPGSTLKGYIRTAIIRALLTSLSKDQIVSIIRSGLNLTGKPVEVGAGIEGELLRRPRLRKQGAFVDILETILISDPVVSGLRKTVRRIIVAHRANLKSLVAENIAVVVEPSEKTTLEYNVKVIAYPSSPSRIVLDQREERHEISKALERIYELRNKIVPNIADSKWMLGVLRDHGCRLIDLELSEIPSELHSYRELLESWRKSLCSGDAKCVPARIGFATGRETKTILDIVREYTPEKYQEVASYMYQAVGHTWDALTIKLVEWDGRLIGLGWCELCLE